MAQSKQQQETIKLGKKIVRELNLENSGSTLDAWMSHFIAEKIEQVESETDPHKKALYQKECFDSILAIWDRRKVRHDNLRPLASLESILKILSLMVPESEKPEPTYRNNDKDPLEEFAILVSGNSSRIVDAALALSLLPDKLLKAKDWKDQAGTLMTDDERLIIEKLEEYLSDYRGGIRIVFDYGEEKENEDTFNVVFVVQKIEALIEEQRESLEQVKNHLRT